MLWWEAVRLLVPPPPPVTLFLSTQTLEPGGVQTPKASFDMIKKNHRVKYIKRMVRRQEINKLSLIFSPSSLHLLWLLSFQSFFPLSHIIISYHIMLCGGSLYKITASVLCRCLWGHIQCVDVCNHTGLSAQLSKPCEFQSVQTFVYDHTCVSVLMDVISLCSGCLCLFVISLHTVPETASIFCFP